MKKTAILLALSCLASWVWALPSSNTATTNAHWNPVNDPSVISYTVYVGTASRSYTQTYSVPVTQTNLNIGGLLRGQLYYGSVTCTSTNGLESDFSNESTYTPPMKPGPPQNFAL